MKKYLFMIAALCLLQVGCDNNSSEPVSSTVTAVAVNEEIVSKMALTPETGHLEWQCGDTIAVCASTKGNGRFVPFALIGGGRSQECRFMGELADTAIKDCAVYPYISGSEPFFSQGDLFITLPSRSQRWEKATMAPMYADAANFASEGKLYFRNLGGVLNLKIKSIPAGTCEVAVISSSKISGQFQVKREGGDAFIGTGPCSSPEEGQSVSFMAPLAANQSQFFFNFPLPVGTYPRLRFQCRNSAGEVLSSFMTEEPLTITRGEVCMLTPVADALPRFADSGTIRVSPDGASNAAYEVKIANNETYRWLLSLVSFDGCVSAASVSGTTLTYSVPANKDTSVTCTGKIVLKLSDPTGIEPELTKAYTVTQSNKSARFFVKVTEGKADWEGVYLIAYETENEAYVLNAGEFSDSDCPSAVVPIEAEGIGYTTETAACRVTIKKHAPDGGNVNPTAIEGKYTIFLLSGATGIGRYAASSFGFNNNTAHARFVESISYNPVAGCVEISCLTNAKKDTFLKCDTAYYTFGFGLPSEVADAGRYADIQLYELK